MAVRDGRPQALAPRRSPMQARHLGGSARLVDEDQTLGVKVELAVEPGAATPQDVGTVLLRRMPGLFSA